MKIVIRLFFCIAIVLASGCGMGPTQSHVCGPIRLFDEDRTLLIGFNPLFDSVYIGHQEHYPWDKYTHRIVINDREVIMEYFEQTAGRDKDNVHHIWHNLVGFRFNRVTRVVVEYSYRLGDIKEGSREALLERRMAQNPEKPDWEIVWEPCTPEPAWRALLGRIVGILFTI